MNNEAYTVGWICALPETELPAAEAMLDEEYPPLDKDAADSNIYTFGRIKHHNVVIACLLAGRYGIVSAAGIAKDMLRTFPLIQLILMVGIGRGLPNNDQDIRLGDVVVSQPTKGHAGVVQYDKGKSHDDGTFEIRGHLDAPPAQLLNAISKLKARHIRREPEFPNILARMLQENPQMAKDFARPGADDDIQSPDIVDRIAKSHIHSNRVRALRTNPIPHYGLIASGNQVVASIDEANRIERLIGGTDPVLCFEMEAAGLMNDSHCVVIRGISDYADRLKNDRWQAYATAAAAAYAKELLSIIPAGNPTSTASKESAASRMPPAASHHSVSQSSNSFGHTSNVDGKVIQGNYNGVNFSF